MPRIFVFLLLLLLVSLVLAKPKNQKVKPKNARQWKAKPKPVKCRDWVRIQTPNAGLQVLKDGKCRGPFCTTGFRLIQKGNRITPIEFKGCGTEKGLKVLGTDECRNTGSIEMGDDGTIKSGRICRCDTKMCNKH